MIEDFYFDVRKDIEDGLMVDISSPGGIALLCCSCRAAYLKANRRSIRVNEIMHEYAAFVGMPFRWVERQIFAALWATDLTPRQALCLLAMEEVQRLGC